MASSKHGVDPISKATHAGLFFVLVLFAVALSSNAHFNSNTMLVPTPAFDHADLMVQCVLDVIIIDSDGDKHNREQ